MNNPYTYDKREENKDRLKSAAITAAIWAGLLLFLFMYKFVERIPEKSEVETRMLINFGDNRNGAGLEEPAEQEGSQAAESATTPQESSPEKSTALSQGTPEPVRKPEKEQPAEKKLSGNSETRSVTSKENTAKKKEATKSASATNAKSSKSSGSKAAAANAKTGSGDGKGNAAIGNLIRGRGTKTGNQGTGTGPGNSGDPLGGDGDGDSKIGIDRRLTGYIPGTMGRGGAQPSHSCSASGTITISYTVDKAGNVVSARRSGGVSDPCVVSTSVSWVKRYVKAEKATSSSTGTYRITF